jgi:GT2 family glycosyltransferase
VEATVLITTKNRRDELRRALCSALAQRGVAEVIVVDDGSTDGTSELVAREFPAVRLHRSEVSCGLIVQRNLGIMLARCPVVVTIDDDAVFTGLGTVEQTLRDFDHPLVGAVAIPCVDIGLDQAPHPEAPNREGVYVTSEFTGGSSAVRREVFRELGGFRESIFHQGEERDFCVRLLDAGWVVRVGRAEPIHHYPSVNRDLRRMDLYGRRNIILYAWFNEPFPSAAVRMVEMCAQGMRSGFRVRRPAAAAQGLLLGFRACWQLRSDRKPLPRPVIRLFRRLWKRGPLPLAEIEPLLPRGVRTPEHVASARVA